MRKKITLFIMIFMLLITAGCSLGNTPTSSVERVLSKYNTNDEDIVLELDDYVNNSNLTKEQSEKYKEVYLKQFKDMKYEIKNETIEGNTAVVTVQLTVYDYYSAEKEANEYLTNNPNEFKTDEVYDETLFTNYKLERLSKVKDKVDYTIDFTLTKVDNSWEVNDLTNEQLEKIHGVYAY
ncbi:MAG: hypothetical protein IJD92_02065 [Bacilli bacterium]|nr:hypothetical protein [Bacilli bacterium]